MEQQHQPSDSNQIPPSDTNPSEQKQEPSTKPKVVNYLERLNSKPSNSKVGQSFVTSINQDATTQPKVASYLERLNAKPSNSKVGQSFITNRSAGNCTETNPDAENV
jgi:hypothetical protein